MIPIKNTDKQFGLVSILLHWVMAILIVTLLCVGLYMTDLPVSVLKLKLFRWHKEFGMLVLMLLVVRLVWRISNKTPTLGELPLWERLAARATHWAFYVLMFVMPMTGWLKTSAAGVPVSFFGLFVFPDIVSSNEAVRELFTDAHEWLAYLLIALICLHVAAAFKHYLIDKDDILQRMLWP